MEQPITSQEVIDSWDLSYNSGTAVDALCVSALVKSPQKKLEALVRAKGAIQKEIEKLAKLNTEKSEQ